MQITKEDFATAYYDYTNADLAEKFDVHINTIRNVARKLGLPPKPKGRHKSQLKIQIISSPAS